MTLLLSVVILATLLPVFLWHRTRALGIYVGGLYLGYCFLSVEWLYGDLTFCHDSYQGPQFFFNITRQWVQSESEFGWNPFLGAGQPMAIMSNLIFYVPAFLLAKAEMLFNVSPSPFEFANLVVLSMMFFSASGMVLLLQLLFKNSWVTFFGATAFVWGGMFVYNLHQFWPALFCFPIAWALFFLFHSIKTRSWPGLFLLALFTGSLANHYIPLYVYLTLFLIFAGLWAAKPKGMRKWWQGLKPIRRWPNTGLCLVLFVLSASPAIYSFIEMQDYVSPSRGFTERGTVTSENSGNQVAVSAPLSTYFSLLQRNWSPEGSVHWHMAAYLGVVPCLLILSFLPLVLRKDKTMRVLLAVIAVQVLLGTGDDTPVWGLLVDHVPLFNMLRHPAGFSSMVTVLAIILAAACVKELIQLKKWSLREWLLLSGGLVVFILLLGFKDKNLNFDSGHVFEGHGIWFAALWILAMLLFAAFHRYPKVFPAHDRLGYGAGALGLLMLVHLVELGVYTKTSYQLSPDMEGLEIVKWNLAGVYLLAPKKGLCRVPDYELTPMRYPTQWTSRCSECREDYAPFQVTPMVFKESIWTHSVLNFMFMLHKDFAKFFHFPLADLNQQHKLLGGDLFYLAPDDSGWQFDHSNVSWMDNLQERKINRVGEIKELGTVEALPSDDPNRINVRINASRDVYLLRMENFHAGWQVMLDGQPVTIKRTAPHFQTLPVPKGEHLVEFTFSSWFDTWVWVSVGAQVSGWILLNVWLSQSRKRRAHTAPL